ncbi:UDP-N-acetylglucosamine 2-epimerase [Cobetia crustatorum]|uniref:UDP-N-acetylglucosamine 2-epimerase n=1 Tax=Cobetia crustatorum TaxID=553385 RepID=UPI000469248D|nr:UDP-N-acetylglucosamine 2-epimerase [Cobetia crustatorum]
MKKVLILTGTRADFGKLKGIMRFIEEHDDLELHIFGTGMHMMKRYGSTYREIEKEKFQHTYFIPNQNSSEPMSSVLGNTISIFSRLTEEISPDLIIIHGDRLEALAGAAVGALQNILVCHIEGGEVSGTVDELIRHSVSKLSNIHMVANEKAKKRLMQMGEGDDYIYIIGSPDLDVMNSKTLPSLQDSRLKYEIDFAKYSIALFHPVTTEKTSFKEYSASFFDALKYSGNNYIVVYPNNDNGSNYIVDEIEKLKDDSSFRVFPSINFEHFLVLLKNADMIIGNSSAGIREAPFYGVPTVNVGTRQQNRYSSDTIIDVDYSCDDIISGIEMLDRISHIGKDDWFGDGNSLALFSAALGNEKFWTTPTQKLFMELA